MTRFTSSNIPPQNGRSAVVTGTGGLGFETALALAKAGGEVIIAGRNRAKGEAAASKIRAASPAAQVSFAELDLASLASVAAFTTGLKDRRSSLDLLINNAGVMVPPVRQATTDGFELQLGTNYLGHFALTGQLIPLLRRGQDARVISLSSVAARGGMINFDDLNAMASYQPMPVYSQSKLACLMFAFELQRLSQWQGWGISSIAAHPGIARTDLLHNGPGRWSAHGLARSALPFLFQPAAQGALPTLFAATSAAAQSGGYYGPHGMGETRGYPVAARIPSQALDETAAERLWQISEALTGVHFESAGAGGKWLTEPLTALQMQAA